MGRSELKTKERGLFGKFWDLLGIICLVGANIGLGFLFILIVWLIALGVVWVLS